MNKRRVGFNKFSTKVIVMTIVIFGVVLTLLISLLTYREKVFLEENFFRRGQDMVTGVREASRIALLAEDTDRLESIAAENMKHRQEILYIVFYRDDLEEIYASAKDDRFPGKLEHLQEEFHQQLSNNESLWKDEFIVRNMSDQENGPVSEFWSRISSSEVGELEMLAGPSVLSGNSSTDTVSGYICMGVSRAELKGIVTSIARDAVIAGLLTLLAMSMATAWLLRRLMAPLSELVSGVQAVAEGEMESTISVRSRDEVGRLADEFNKMVVVLKERQDMLLKSEYKFRSLFERIHYGILLFDRDGDILDNNPAMAEMVGCQDNLTLANTSFKDFFVNHRDYKMLLDRIQQECNIHDMQLVLKDQQSGREVETNVSITCQRDEKGIYEYSEAVIVDMTHIKELERRLLQAQKMEAIGTLAGGIAHDFNNILTGVVGYTDLMSNNQAVARDTALNGYLVSIKKSVKRARDLVSQLMGFARKGRYLEQVFNLNNTAREVSSLIAETIDRSIEIRLDTAPDLWSTKGDEGQIYQSLLNISLNGCDAMPDGGVLEITTGNKVNREELPLLDMVMPAGRYVFVRVKDNGDGMDGETAAKIFEPFYTTKAEGKGTGLGMSMVHGIISNHNGYIQVESHEGLGTSMTIYLPVIREEKAGDVQIERKARQQEDEVVETVFLKNDAPGFKSARVKDIRPKEVDTFSVLLKGDLPQSDESMGSSTIINQSESVSEEEGRKIQGAEIGPKNILLVDDEETILNVNKLFFNQRDDFFLQTASSGEEAVAILKEDNGTIDIVVMDISMPGMGGKKAFRIIHELYPSLPVIIATGYAQDNVVNALLDEGVKDLLLKPYMGGDLVKIITAYFQSG